MHPEGDDEVVVENKWGPQHITTIVAILSLVGTYFWTIADFRVAITDLTNKTTALKEEVIDLNKRISGLDIEGGRKQILSDALLKQLEDRTNRNTILLEKLLQDNLARENFNRKR